MCFSIIKELMIFVWTLKCIIHVNAIKISGVRDDFSVFCFNHSYEYSVLYHFAQPSLLVDIARSAEDVTKCWVMFILNITYSFDRRLQYQLSHASLKTQFSTDVTKINWASIYEVSSHIANICTNIGHIKQKYLH